MTKNNSDDNLYVVRVTKRNGEIDFHSPVQSMPNCRKALQLLNKSGSFHFDGKKAFIISEQDYNDWLDATE